MNMIEMTGPQRVQLPAQIAVGLPVRINNPMAEKNMVAEINAAWGRFYLGNWWRNIPNQTVPPVVYGIYTDYESDFSGAYTLLPAVTVVAVESMPPGFETLVIPAGSYMKFTFYGEQPASVTRGWMDIWAFFKANRTMTRLYATDFEHYVSADKVDIYVGIQ